MRLGGNPTAADRIFAALPYALVLYDGLPFSESLLNVFPPLQYFLAPILLPVIFLYRSLPFGSLIIFFGLYFLVIRNERISRFIRFNAMQALLLTIILFLLQLIVSLMPTLGGLIFFTKTLNTTIFLSVLALFGYSVVQCFRGQYPEIPSVSEAVDPQVF